MILCDTGPLVAAAVTSEVDHHICVELRTGLRLANRRLLRPGTVLVETGYLLDRDLGPRAEAAFLRGLAAGDFELIELTPDDSWRMAELVDKYADLRLGTTDASLVALAERLRIEEIATLNHRDFATVRPRHIRTLTLLP